jgi:hypothetical protein
MFSWLPEQEAPLGSSGFMHFDEMENGRGRKDDGLNQRRK